MNVSAWLLLNSMRLESLQFLQLQSQELLNVFRKKALAALMREVDGGPEAAAAAAAAAAKPGDQDGGDVDVGQRIRRFAEERSGGGGGGGGAAAQIVDIIDSVREYREPLDYSVAADVALGRRFCETIDDMVAARAPKPVFALGAADAARVADVRSNAEQIFAAKRDVEQGLEQEQEQEQEQQQEQEEQAQEEEEEEEMKMSQYSRDNEEANPWLASTLADLPDLHDIDPEVDFKDLVLGDNPLYPLRMFKLRDVHKPLAGLPASILVSSNFFRPRWSGLGTWWRALCWVSLICPAAAPADATADTDDAAACFCDD